MAELLLKKMLSDVKEKKINVKSAGVEPSGWPDLPEEAKEVLRKEGVAEAKHKPQGVTPAMAREADIILVMEEYHRSAVIHEFPAAASKVHLLKSYAGIKSAYDGIYDPFGQPIAAYEKAMKDIKEGLTALLKKIQTPKVGAHHVRKD